MLSILPGFALAVKQGAMADRKKKIKVRGFDADPTELAVVVSYETQYLDPATDKVVEKEPGVKKCVICPFFARAARPERGAPRHRVARERHFATAITPTQRRAASGPAELPSVCLIPNGSCLPLPPRRAPLSRPPGVLACSPGYG